VAEARRLGFASRIALKRARIAFPVSNNGSPPLDAKHQVDLFVPCNHTLPERRTHAKPTAPGVL